MLHDRVIRSKINQNKTRIQDRNTFNSTDAHRKKRMKYQFCNLAKKGSLHTVTEADKADHNLCSAQHTT